MRMCIFTSVNCVLVIFILLCMYISLVLENGVGSLRVTELWSFEREDDNNCLHI